MSTLPWSDVEPSDAVARVAAGDFVVIDVREQFETDAYHIKDAHLIPLSDLPRAVDDLDPDAPTLLVCEHGVRSVNACAFLAEQGFTQLHNLRHGMSAWPGPVDGHSLPPCQQARGPR